MITSQDIFEQQREWEDIQPGAPPPPPPDFDVPVHRIEPSKSSAEMIAQGLADQVSEGLVDPVEAAIKLKAIILTCETALEKMRPSVVEAVSKGSSGKWGCTVEKAEVGTKYDFSKNPSWTEYNKTLEETKAEIRELEARLKRIPAGKTLVDDDTGEALTGPGKSSTTSFKVTLAE